jgi:hypothetical protein
MLNKTEKLNEQLIEFSNLQHETKKQFINNSKNLIKKIKKGLKGKPKETSYSHLVVLFLLDANLETIKTIEFLLQKNKFDESMVLMRLMLERAAIGFHSLNHYCPVKTF